MRVGVALQVVVERSLAGGRAAGSPLGAGQTPAGRVLGRRLLLPVVLVVVLRGGLFVTLLTCGRIETRRLELRIITEPTYIENDKNYA